VLDDASKDASLEIMKSFPFSFTKKIFSNEMNRGPVYTFKKLSALCNGDFIAFCDQDDIWLPEKLELSLEKMMKMRSDIPAIVFSDLSIIDANGKLLQNSFWKQMQIQPNKFTLTDILFGNIVTGCTALINKGMAEELFKMPLDIMMYDHWMALIAYSFGEYDFINKPTVKYRAHSNTVTNKSKLPFLNIFLNDLEQKEFYLHENINQAIKFKDIYSSILTADQRKELDQFINLQHKNFFQKRFLKYRRSFFRKLQ